MGTVGASVVTVVVGEKEWGDPATTWDHEESVELGAMAEAEVDTEADAGVMVKEHVHVQCRRRGTWNRRRRGRCGRPLSGAIPAAGSHRNG